MSTLAFNEGFLSRSQNGETLTTRQKALARTHADREEKRNALRRLARLQSD